MTHASTLAQGIDPAAPADGYHRLQLDRLADCELVSVVSGCLERPKVAPADSFVLHAPLELLARAGLLDLVAPDAREPARIGLARLASAYAAAGAEVGDPTEPDGSVAGLAPRLEAAVAAGDLDEVDRLAAAIGGRAGPADLRAALGPWVVGSLAAAAHASIGLHLLGRSGAASAVSGRVLRGTLRELARHPDWRLRWFEDPTDDIGAPAVLREALLDVPVLGVPGSTFIYPLMHQAEESGLARQLLAGVARDEAALPAATTDLMRLAAWSMLQEGPEHAPYGWSHCLTMPQAVLSGAAHGAVAPSTAIAVAATYVVGFRTASGTRPLDPAWSPPRSSAAGLDEAISAGPEEAAAWAWASAQRGEHRTLIAHLAARASEHEDAHLVKYTLACIDAAQLDDAATPLYLAAAASLRGWWAIHDAHGSAE